jgi:hypothetical protein
MAMQRVSVLSAVAFALSVSCGYAGPCSGEIDSTQARIDARLAAIAGAGGTARESNAATMHRQPTPESIARAEEGLGEVSARVVQAVGPAMERARAADAAGDKSACEQALAEVQKVLGP